MVCSEAAEAPAGQPQAQGLNYEPCPDRTVRDVMGQTLVHPVGRQGRGVGGADRSP